MRMVNSKVWNSVASVGIKSTEGVNSFDEVAAYLGSHDISQLGFLARVTLGVGLQHCDRCLHHFALVADRRLG